MADATTITVRWADGSVVKQVSHMTPSEALQGPGDVSVYVGDADSEHRIFIPRRVLIGMLRALEGSDNG